MADMHSDRPQKQADEIARRTAVSIGWTIPITILLCTMAGWYLGGRWGSKKTGVVIGWLFGMMCVAYDIWKTARNPAASRKPPSDGAKS